MSIAGQIVTVTGASLLSVPRRPGNSMAIVISIAGVVAVLICVFAMYLGFRVTIQGDGQPDRAVIMARQANDEGDSSLSRDNLNTIRTAPGIRHDATGQPLASGEVVFSVPASRKRDQSDVNITLRSVSSQFFAMRPELKIVAGRMYHPGVHELMAGAAARAQFAGLNVGERVRMQGGDWTVIGVFAGANGARESELVGDAETLLSAYRNDTYNIAVVSLESPASLEKVKTYLNADASLVVDTRSEPAYLATASGTVNTLLRLVTFSIGSIMALGALFGALNSMHAAVAARTVELATLRAIGFAPVAVATAVLAEALVLALIGAAIGTLVAYAGFNGAVISTLGGSLWDSQLVYSLTVSPTLIAIAVAVACALGILGGLFPAIRASRTNIATALHET
jgi:putative ABC transport system permease protein